MGKGQLGNFTQAKYVSEQDKEDLYTSRSSMLHDYTPGGRKLGASHCTNRHQLECLKQERPKRRAVESRGLSSHPSLQEAQEVCLANK